MEIYVQIFRFPYFLFVIFFITILQIFRFPYFLLVIFFITIFLSIFKNYSVLIFKDIRDLVSTTRLQIIIILVLVS